IDLYLMDPTIWRPHSRTPSPGIGQAEEVNKPLDLSSKIQKQQTIKVERPEMDLSPVQNIPILPFPISYSAMMPPATFVRDELPRLSSVKPNFTPNPETLRENSFRTLVPSLVHSPLFAHFPEISSLRFNRETSSGTLENFREDSFSSNSSSSPERPQYRQSLADLVHSTSMIKEYNSTKLQELPVLTPAKKNVRPFKRVELLTGEEDFEKYREKVMAEHKSSSLKPQRGAKRSSTPSSPPSGNEAKSQMDHDEAYREKRRRNNEAAKRSRDARRQKEDDLAISVEYLTQENKRLREEHASCRQKERDLRVTIDFLTQENKRLLEGHAVLTINRKV
ncbi:hypothetical protein L9F63_011774, partial [Diploptera punctata]